MTDTASNSDFHARAQALVQARKAQDPARKRPSAAGNLARNFGYPATIIGAFLTGLLTVLLSRYVRFQFTGGTLAGEDVEMAMVMDAVIAIAAGIFIRQLFKFEAKAYITANSVGVTFMILAMHNFVHYLPAPFELAFSPDWVETVVTTTKPNSLVFADMHYQLGASEMTVGGAEEPAEEAIGEIPINRGAAQSTKDIPVRRLQ